MRYNVHDVLKKKESILYEKTYNLEKSIFEYDFKLLSFKRMKCLIYKELTHFQIFTFIQEL